MRPEAIPGNAATHPAGETSETAKAGADEAALPPFGVHDEGAARLTDRNLLSERYAVYLFSYFRRCHGFRCNR